MDVGEKVWRHALAIQLAAADVGVVAILVCSDVEVEKDVCAGDAGQ